MIFDISDAGFYLRDPSGDQELLTQTVWKVVRGAYED